MGTSIQGTEQAVAVEEAGPAASAWKTWRGSGLGGWLSLDMSGGSRGARAGWLAATVARKCTAMRRISNRGRSEVAGRQAAARF